MKSYLGESYLEGFIDKIKTQHFYTALTISVEADNPISGTHVHVTKLSQDTTSQNKLKDTPANIK